jgi:hypothetical protein
MTCYGHAVFIPFSRENENKKTVPFKGTVIEIILIVN